MRNSFLLLTISFWLSAAALAQQDVTNTTRAEAITPTVVSSSAVPPPAQASVPAVTQASAQTSAQPQAQAPASLQTAAVNNASEAVRYTLGPDDIINVTVQRHPEFTGDFPINKEGKIQFRYVGDIDVNGLTKKRSKIR